MKRHKSKEYHEISNSQVYVGLHTVGCLRTNMDVLISVADSEKVFDIFVTEKQFTSLLRQSVYTLIQLRKNKQKSYKRMRIMKKIFLY